MKKTKRLWLEIATLRVVGIVAAFFVKTQLAGRRTSAAETGSAASYRRDIC